MKAVVLTTTNARLLPYAAEHDAQTVAWLNTQELRDTFGISAETTLESHRQWMANATDVVAWAILTQEHRHCGNTLLHCNVRHRSAYFQIYLGDPASRGRGIGREVLRAVLLQAFGPLRLHRVWLHTVPGNTIAERLYVAEGFIQEGMEREALLRSGRFHSQLRWSILESEWPPRAGGRP